MMDALAAAMGKNAKVVHARWRYAYRAYGFVGRANAVPPGKQAAGIKINRV